MITLEKNDYESRVKGSKTFKFTMEMVPYGDHRKRTIRVWLPSDYDDIKRFPVIYMHDGQDLFSREGGEEKIHADIAMSELLCEGISAIIVGIDNAENRGTELTPPYERNAPDAVVNGIQIPFIPGKSTTKEYAEFIVNYVKPAIDETFLTLPDKDHTYVGGISAGGSTSYYMFLEYPDIFGKAMVLSPGLPMFQLDSLLSDLENYDKSKLSGRRILFYNGNQDMDRTSVDYVLSVYRKLETMGMTGKDIMYLLDTRQGHNDEAWRKHMKELFFFIFTGRAY